ncbi:tRNA 2-selenouridine synthase [Sulfitobacter donghicola DSW-25 = KCTC 12864 = JCM 14565]|uniref:tRNA 2-selenouridine synthase n=1 Tax=Sulfitobacter donghicola DSW-25 = KCTC 12864 = JCM 14565 TaxID=1300350 RepID=A0A073IKX1_9RHOB|nr:tRNA 2-selenouridine synthase [Sulfitobacter donghicola DSW-25 = KCTC 12864 = JCM 14565]
MRETLTSLSSIAEIGADTIIDVRAPAEFAQDHIPGAINLPVLSDAQRAEVGTIYVQDSPFRARKIGAALVAANVAQHLQGPLAAQQGDWQPLVYCWRGGQRSGSFATILEQVGWRVRLIEGGYQSYRRKVSEALYTAPVQHRLMLISGGTGTAKTALLHHLHAQGAQVLDLEGMAQHRGSLFGAMKGGQPAQKMFESRLAAALSGLDPAKLTWVEAESNKIGARVIPPMLWHAMRAAPRIEVQAALAERGRFLATAYRDLIDDPQGLVGLIDQLRPYHAAAHIDSWRALAKAGDWPRLAAQLMQEHYDPRYAKSQARAAPPVMATTLPSLDDDGLHHAAIQLHAQFS